MNSVAQRSKQVLLAVSVISFCAAVAGVQPAYAGGETFIDDSGWEITTKPDGSELVQKISGYGVEQTTTTIAQSQPVHQIETAKTLEKPSR